MRFACKRCGYQFEATSEKERCSYCGDKTLEVVKDADELISEIE